MIREYIANSLISAGRTFGQFTGLQMAVEISDHSIKTEMEQPDQSNRAWDTSMFKHGNIFLDGHATPIKPVVNHNEGLENKNTAELEEGEAPEETDGEGEEGSKEATPKADVISSSRYKDFMRQELISQLLTPEQRWNKMLYGLLAVGALQFLTVVIVLYANGSFA